MYIMKGDDETLESQFPASFWTCLKEIKTGIYNLWKAEEKMDKKYHRITLDEMIEYKKGVSRVMKKEYKTESDKDEVRVILEELITRVFQDVKRGIPFNPSVVHVLMEIEELIKH